MQGVVKTMGVIQKGQLPVPASRAAGGLDRAALAGRHINRNSIGRVLLSGLQPSKAKFFIIGILGIGEAHRLGLCITRLL